jgi:hypothetical protein
MESRGGELLVLWGGLIEIFARSSGLAPLENN